MPGASSSSRVLAIGCAIAIAIVLAAAGAPSAGAAVSGANGLIAYECGPDLCVIRPDGSGARRLTTHAPASVDSRPAWSPDGSRVAFIRGSASTSYLYVVNADGSGLRRLAAAGGPASWSPYGDEIAASCGGEVCVIDLRGFTVQLTTPIPRQGLPPTTAGSPAWSPDGRRLAYTTNRAGGDQCAGDVCQPGGSTCLFVMNADGTAQRPLSRDCGRGGAPGPVMGNPDWSPDGRLVAYDYSCEECLDRPRSATRLWALAADSRIAQSSPGQGDGYAADPSWAPDGSALAYVTAGPQGRTIAIRAVDGSGARDLTAGLAPAWQPVWHRALGLRPLGRVRIAASAASVHSGATEVPLRCIGTAIARCAVGLRLVVGRGHRRETLAGSEVSIRAGATRLIRLRLSRLLQRTLRTGPVRALATAKDSRGPEARRTVTLRRAP